VYESEQKSDKAVLFDNAQLTIAKKCCSRQRGGVLGPRAPFALVTAARNMRFGAKPGSVAPVRRRRNMICYTHSSAVFQMRRETLKIYFFLGLGGRQSLYLDPHCFANEVNARRVTCRYGQAMVTLVG
jgi:hypothetical protein